MASLFAFSLVRAVVLAIPSVVTVIAVVVLARQTAVNLALASVQVAFYIAVHLVPPDRYAAMLTTVIVTREGVNSPVVPRAVKQAIGALGQNPADTLLLTTGQAEVAIEPVYIILHVTVYAVVVTVGTGIGIAAVVGVAAIRIIRALAVGGCTASQEKNQQQR